MNEVVPLVLAWAVGLGLGLFYFGGLWLTMRRVATSQWPVVLILGSLLARMAVTLVVFYLVMAGRWERLLACLAGFVLMRFVIVSRTRPQETQEPAPPQEEEYP